MMPAATMNAPIEPLWKKFRGPPRASAGDLLRHFSINDTPVPVERIVREMGIAIEIVETSEFAGSSDTNGNQATIRVNAADVRVRQRFTVAHELGHVLLHPLGQNFRDPDFLPSTHFEVEANGFAADLLMPEWMVRSAFNAIGPGSLRLAAMFDVSVASIEYRLRQLQYAWNSR